MTGMPNFSKTVCSILSDRSSFNRAVRAFNLIIRLTFFQFLAFFAGIVAQIAKGSSTSYSSPGAQGIILQDSSFNKSHRQILSL